MIYKKKLTLLSSLVILLGLVYILTLVFDPERQYSKAFAWLEPRLISLADGIEISGPAGTAVLKRKNNVWVFNAGAADYPVKQGRVEDFLAALSRKDVYPLRASSDEAREKLGLSPAAASRIIVRGGAGLPLLDLLIGKTGVVGGELYLGRAGEKEVYSGEDRFTLYTDSDAKAWYDLRLFPSAIDAALVQQAEVTLPAAHTPPASYTLRRSNGGWVLGGNENLALDSLKVDSWLRSILEAEGEDFDANAPAVIEGSITLRLGDGTARTIQVGPVDKEKRRNAAVSPKDHGYVLAGNTVDRLFRESGYFHK